jgi:hypothetical protein
MDDLPVPCEQQHVVSLNHTEHDQDGQAWRNQSSLNFLTPLISAANVKFTYSVTSMFKQQGDGKRNKHSIAYIVTSKGRYIWVKKQELGGLTMKITFVYGGIFFWWHTDISLIKPAIYCMEIFIRIAIPFPSSS